MKSTFLRLSWLTSVLLVAAAAQAAPPKPTTSSADLRAAHARYTEDVALCKSGRSHQDRATCLREAGAALAEAKRGALDKETADLAANRIQRCNPLPEDQRKDCIARMQGQGTTSGSVEGGGIYRELVTRETGTASVPASNAGAAQPDKPKPQ